MTNSTVTVRAKNSTAWARVILTPILNKHRIEFYRSNRVKNPEKMWVRDVESVLQKKFAAVEKRKEEKKKYSERTAEVGDILVHTVGSQVYFYRVTELVGKQSVKLETLEGKIVEGTNYVGKMAPEFDVPGKPMKGTFRANGRIVRTKTRFGHTASAYPYTGNPIPFTIYFD